MKYIKEYWQGGYTPYSDYLINGDTESYEKVESFFYFFKMDLTLLELWLHAKNIYGVYPTKITKTEVMYIAEDRGIVTIKLIDGSIDKIEKVVLSSGTNGIIRKKVFNGKYSTKRFDTLIV